ncbi:MAG: response regulator transcription factor [Polyangiaceae bacterium]
MRGIQYCFESLDDLAVLLEVGGDEQELEIHDTTSLRDGEWIMATFSVGEDNTSVAACVVDRGDDLRLSFSERDWARLWQFANSGGPPSVPPASLPAPAVEIEVPQESSVLVVDDDPDLQQVVKALLASAGFAARAVSSAEEAFDSLREAHADVVVLDWNLPGMSGVDFCKRIRREPRLERLPILFLTAHSSTRDVLTAFNAGADDYVAKPFRAPELAARVLSLLRRAQLPPPSVR